VLAAAGQQALAAEAGQRAVAELEAKGAALLVERGREMLRLATGDAGD
jgi:hypothetical protein